MPEVHRRRLQIEEEAEEFLRVRGALTGERLHAVNLARFEIARSQWQINEPFSREVADRIYETEPDFVPDDTAAAPPRYRIALRLLGFRWTERLAKAMRGPSRTDSRVASRSCENPTPYRNDSAISRTGLE